MEQVKLNFPIRDFKWDSNVSQLFGVSKDYYEKNFGIHGHQGIDFVVRDEKMGYGTKIYSVHTQKALCTKVSIDATIRTHGNGVYLLEELEDGTKLESLYWHISEPTIRPNEWIEPQQPLFHFDKTIALIGNTGQVFPKPTREMPYLGSHLHLALRLYDKNGIMRDNEYKGFIDPTPYLYREGQKLPVKFTRNLSIGSEGDDVSWLQTILKIELSNDVKFEPIAHFGTATRIAVSILQKKHGIEPTYGFVGPKTREYLNTTYAG